MENVWNIFGKSVFLATHTNSMQEVWFGPLFFLTTALISFLLAFIAQKIPLLKKIVG